MPCILSPVLHVSYFFQQWLIFVAPYRMIILWCFCVPLPLHFQSLSTHAIIFFCCVMFSHTPIYLLSTDWLFYGIYFLMYCIMYFYNFHLSVSIFICHLFILLFFLIFCLCLYRSYTTFLLLLFILLTFEFNVFFLDHIFAR